MCWENESCRMDAHGACLYTSALGTFRAVERKGVPLHRASRHVGTDVTNKKIYNLCAMLLYPAVARTLFGVMACTSRYNVPKYYNKLCK
jgi:hypothetical protein